MSLLTTTFSIAPFPGPQPPRSARRIAINADLLRSNKICAGDTVLVYAGPALHAAGIAWPALSTDLPANVIGLSDALLSEDVVDVRDARLAVLSGAAAWSNKALSAAGLPLPKEIKEAFSAQVIEAEESVLGGKVLAREDLRGKGKGRDWLMLLIRELLGMSLDITRMREMLMFIFRSGPEVRPYWTMDNGHIRK